MINKKPLSMTFNVSHIKVLCLFLPTVVAMLATSSCKPRTLGSGSRVKTDLIDNETVHRTFEAYKKSSKHCTPGPTDSRAIVTGFGLFGHGDNISGVNALNMSRESFWPKKIKLADWKNLITAEPVHLSDELKTENGVWIKQRTLEIDQRKIEVCFLYLDVQWDLAASIILYESSLFKPDVVIMGGMNGAEETVTYWETQAINSARVYEGFTSDGQKDLGNIPKDKESKILENHPFEKIVDLTWNGPNLASATAPIIKSISTEYDSLSRPMKLRNNYICNNVSYAVSVGLSGQDVALAGELIHLPASSKTAKVGFLHYPSRASEEDRIDNIEHIFGWNSVVAQAIVSSL